jgi:hypothetical protein
MKLLLTTTIIIASSSTLPMQCMDKDFTHGLHATKALSQYYLGYVDPSIKTNNEPTINKRDVRLKMNTQHPSNEQLTHMNTFYHECKDHLNVWEEKNNETRIKMLYSIMQTKNNLQRFNAITMPMMSCFAYKYKKSFAECWLDNLTETSTESFHLTLFFEQLHTYDNDLREQNLTTPTAEQFNKYRTYLLKQITKEQKAQYAESIGIPFDESIITIDIPKNVGAERFRKLLIHIQAMLESNDIAAQKTANRVYKKYQIISTSQEESSNSSLQDDNFDTSA